MIKFNKPSQHCSDAIYDQRKILEKLKKSPAYFPDAIAQKHSLVNFTTETIRRLRESVKFHIPYGGNIMVDMFNGMAFKESVKNYLHTYRLPFPLVALEYDFIVNEENNPDFIESNLPYTATVILVHEELRNDQNPLLYVRLINKIFSPYSEKYEWHCLPYDIVVDFDKCRIDDHFAFFTSIIPINESYMAEHNHKDFLNDTENELGVLLQFLIAMSCRNVTSNTEPPPSITENKKRMKKGLEKRYEYRNIVINTKNGVADTTKKHGSQGGTVATHIRRGHIRHYENKNVWIEQTVINADKGQIPAIKKYVVK